LNVIACAGVMSVYYTNTDTEHIFNLKCLSYILVKYLTIFDGFHWPYDILILFFQQPGALSVIKAISDDVNSNNVNSVFHIGDISYATGFVAEWDFFIHLISPIASRVSYMTAVGNHERYWIHMNDNSIQWFTRKFQKVIIINCFLHYSKTKVFSKFWQLWINHHFGLLNCKDRSIQSFKFTK